MKNCEYAPSRAKAGWVECRGATDKDIDWKMGNGKRPEGNPVKTFFLRHRLGD